MSQNKTQYIHSTETSMKIRKLKDLLTSRGLCDEIGISSGTLYKRLNTDQYKKIEIAVIDLAAKHWNV